MRENSDVALDLLDPRLWYLHEKVPFGAGGVKRPIKPSYRRDGLKSHAVCERASWVCKRYKAVRENKG